MKLVRILLVSLVVTLWAACSDSPRRVLGGDTATLRGTVSVSGFPRSGYTVATGDKTTVTGVTGDYAFFNVPTGYQALEVLHQGYSCRSIFVRVESPETVEDFNLEDPANVCRNLPRGAFCTFYPGPNYQEWLDNCVPP